MASDFKHSVFIAYHGSVDINGTAEIAKSIKKLIDKNVPNYLSYCGPDTNERTYDDHPDLVIPVSKLFLFVVNDSIPKTSSGQINPETSQYFDQYVLFMRNSGLFDLLQNHIINNLVDYVLGIEVGMDTNGRKNRTGHVMEDLVESYLIKAGLVKGKTYFKEMYASEVQKKFNIDLSALSNDGKAEKRFDFVFIGALGVVFACECNFYSGGGSKLNETARSYKTLTLESKGITGFQFVWFTDGTGWSSAKHNLEETFDVLDNLYNLEDLGKGAIDTLVNPTEYIESLLENSRK